MTADIIVPKLGLSTEPLLLVEWKFKESDRVEKGAVVLVVETEKIRYDIEAEASGFLHIILPEGNDAPPGSVVGLIAETEEELTALRGKTPDPAPAAETKETPTAEPPAPAAVPAHTQARARKERIRISPIARKIAEEHMIDITNIVGSGPGGTIVRKDVEKAIAVKATAPAATPAAEYPGKRLKQTLSLTSMQKFIAEHMHRSLQVAAQLTVMGEIEMTEMVKLRQSLVAREEALGTRITYTDLLVFVLANALKDFPIVNSSLVDNEVSLWEDINIGVAVAISDGLVVPVIRNAGAKSLVEISQMVKTLAKKARERTLAPEDVRDGTFTLTNLGAIGSGYRFETVIINQPESGILGVGSIVDRPVVREGQIVIRPIMTSYFTYDHRVINGAVAAQFVGRVAQLLEKPGLLSV